VLVVTCSLLYPMASGVGLVLVCSSYLSVLASSSSRWHFVLVSLFTVVLDGVRVSVVVGIHAGGGLFIVVLDGIGAVFIGTVDVVACSSLYLMASASAAVAGVCG
jgi:hypothetical protein